MSSWVRVPWIPCSCRSVIDLTCCMPDAYYSPKLLCNRLTADQCRSTDCQGLFHFLVFRASADISASGCSLLVGTTENSNHLQANRRHTNTLITPMTRGSNYEMLWCKDRCEKCDLGLMSTSAKSVTLNLISCLILWLPAVCFTCRNPNVVKIIITAF